MDALSKDLLHWYDACARDLPWRTSPSPYRTWLSEVMLQQTQVSTALPYYLRFLARFPTVEDLAEAPLDEVLTMWSGLGYYSRARNLHKAARMVADAGAFPFDIKGLRALPGVGEYMAAAIASIAYGQDEATVDGNIARVMARIHADSGPRKAMWAHAREHLPRGRAGDYNQALMDLGARICRPRGAKCPDCPVMTHCEANRLDSVELFPTRKKKKPTPVRQIAGLLYRQGGQVLLVRRPADGLWGGLWEFPSVESAGPRWRAEEREERWAEICGLPFSVDEPIFETKHVLTHRVFAYALHPAKGASPTDIGGYTALRWVTVDSLPEIGVSALTTRAIRALGEIGP